LPDPGVVSAVALQPLDAPVAAIEIPRNVACQARPVARVEIAIILTVSHPRGRFTESNRNATTEIANHQDFQAALVLTERTFDKAWREEEVKAAALAERQALELELQVLVVLIHLDSWAHVRHDSRTRFLPRCCK
jgi:hypothetical protein